MEKVYTNEQAVLHKTIYTISCGLPALVLENQVLSYLSSKFSSIPSKCPCWL